MSADAPAPVPPVPVLKDIIWERFIKALDIKRRLHVVRAFFVELDRTRRGKPFRFRNDIVWLAMLDVRDKLVIDLCSLSVEMRHGMKPLDPKAQGQYRGGFKRKRGLFIEIRDHHCASFVRTHAPHPGDDEFEIDIHTTSRAAAFDRLFPGCAADSPSVADVEELCERFRVRMIPLVDDRNKNRAHALEGDAGKATMLWVPELESLFEYVERLLGDLYLVSEGGAFGGDNMNHANCEETAADLVDQVLLGNVSDIQRLLARRSREELYARLHEIDDDDPQRESRHARELHFNDRQFGPPFEDWPAR